MSRRTFNGQLKRHLLEGFFLRIIVYDLL